MAIKLPKGTKEFLVVVVAERLGNITTFDGITVTYDVLDEANEKVVDAEIATTEDMTVMCLVDTSTWDEGRYRLFISFAVFPQQPTLGPFRFEVEDYTND